MTQSQHEEMDMKTTIALLAALWLAPTAFAQGSRAEDSPFTNEEARTMSSVWPEIRKASSYDDIDWRSVGLAEAPGGREAERIMAERWGALREASSFADIDWRETTGYRSRDDDRRADRNDRNDRNYGDSRGGAGPFTADEAREMRRAWPEIRKAGDFDDIDWRSAGLQRAPGNAEARGIMTQYWGTLREAESFDDIDWRTTANYRR
jgi:hypothetical protein